MKVLRGGCASRHETSFMISRPSGQDNHVILLLRSGGEYWINGVHYLLSSGYAIILTPHTPYSYHNPEGCLSDDWIHIKLENDESLNDTLICNEPFLLDEFETCSTLMRQLLWESSYTSPQYADENIKALFSVLTNHLEAACNAQETIKKASPYVWELKRLRLEMQNTLTENHSINKYANRLCISASHFQHLYSQTFGISFNNDLIQMRIAYAEILLQTTSFSMETIAEACGYSNPVHFFRQFKKAKGITPAKYRKAMPSPEKY